MIQYIRYKYRLFNLFRNRNKTRKVFAGQLKKMRSEKASEDDIYGIYHEENTELKIVDYEIEVLTTEYFVDLAKVHFIEVPRWDDEKAWIDSSLDPYRKVLSNQAISNLREKIMGYRKMRNEQLVPIITSLTGLIGAVIGVVALFISR
ncbi:MAG: hypothetical protein AXW16_02200 [Cycloclasticus sp. Phe_18]|jgi:hypothetical protein|nr:MAG: hypothetical protein AXW16_02200 [Cycloclasticus sp. Phe_18]